MALTVGQIVRITDEQVLSSQQIINVYFYQITGIAPGDPLEIDEVAQGWWNAVNATLRDCQSSALQHVSVIAEAIGGDKDYFEYTIPPAERAGTSPFTGQQSSTFEAYSITLVPATRQTRPGSKRVAGVVENAMGDFGQIVPTQLSFLEDFGDVIAAPLNIGILGTSEISPVIYRPGNGINPPVVNPVVGYRVALRVSTQNTRKIGKGS